jgi:hypothetical protein
MRGVLLLCVLCGVLAGCSSGSGSDPGNAAEPSGLSVFTGHGLRFAYPANWRYRHAGFRTTMTDPIVDLGSQPLTDPCAGRDGCGFPVRLLRPGAVVVMVQSFGAFTGRPGKSIRRVPPNGGAGINRLHCDDALVASWVTDQWDGSVRRGISFDACFRAPGIARNERAFRAAVKSARTTQGFPRHPPVSS